jgi:hypothetical protein
MADLRPTSQNGSWSKSKTRCTVFMHLDTLADSNFHPSFGNESGYKN